MSCGRRPGTAGEERERWGGRVRKGLEGAVGAGSARGVGGASRSGGGPWGGGRFPGRERGARRRRAFTGVGAGDPGGSFRWWRVPALSAVAPARPSGVEACPSSRCRRVPALAPTARERPSAGGACPFFRRWRVPVFRWWGVSVLPVVVRAFPSVPSGPGTAPRRITGGRSGAPPPVAGPLRPQRNRRIAPEARPEAEPPGPQSPRPTAGTAPGRRPPTGRPAVGRWRAGPGPSGRCPVRAPAAGSADRPCAASPAGPRSGGASPYGGCGR